MASKRPVTVTMEGDLPSMMKKWAMLHAWLETQYSAVDFEFHSFDLTNSLDDHKRVRVTFICHPKQEVEF